MSNNHVWSFSSVGGVKRVNLESGNDLLNLEYLDQKLWTALSCPVHGLEIDHKTLELIDLDKDGQIRVPEILAAIKWVCSVLKNPNDLLQQEAVFPLSAINDSTEEGKKLMLSAKTILKNLKKENQVSLTVTETSNITAIFEGTGFNGDGVITVDSTNSATLITLIEEIIKSVGSLPDRGGKAGIGKEQVVAFFKASEAYNKWLTKSETNAPLILPFGAETEPAYQAFLAIKSKIDDYFIRCNLAEFDPQTKDVLNLLVSRVESISPKDLSECRDEIASYPLAKVEAKKGLPLQGGINPAWQTAFNTLNQLVLQQTTGNKDQLSENEWKQICAKFDAYTQWMSEKKGALVEKLGILRVREILTNDLKKQIEDLIEQDLALESEANSIILVDKLVRYYRDLFRLLKNFVTFYDFYSPGSKAIFLAGTLYIDQRSCNLCIKVQNMDKHLTMVGLSGMYLMYCDCVSRSSAEKMSIVVALTNGDIDNLIVGRNALFYDNNGLDWDATVTKIIENPISIRQAFFSPYRKVSRFFEKQINKFATEQESKVDAKTAESIEGLPAKIETQPKAPPTPFDVGKFVGIFAAIGLALGAIGTAVASFVGGFLGLVWWKMPFAMLGMILLISGPSMIIAYLKLRKRNLAPILDANGWAINARAIVNIPFGNTLTHLASLPKGAVINMNDPFTKKKRPFLKTIIVLSVLAGILLFFLWKYELIHIHF